MRDSDIRSLAAFKEDYPESQAYLLYSQDKWANPRIIFWQAIYEKLLERYRKKGIQIVREKKAGVRDYACEAIGREIRKVRKEEGLSQEELAHKTGIAQQMISRVEKGKENISLITLKKISGALGRRVEISFFLI